MNRLLVAFCFLLSTSVFACPNLTGEYECYEEEVGYYTMFVSQKGKGAKTVYTVKDYEGTQIVKANNKWMKINQNGIKMKMRAFCSGGDVLNVQMNQKDPNFGVVKVHAKISLDANTNILTEAAVTIDGQNFPADASTCTRM